MISGLIDILIFASSFLLVLSFLVFFHELGHYSVGRFFGISVDRFSIGFGKPIAKWKAKSGTEWMIAQIPLGGYVKFTGDATGASNPDAQALAELKAKVEQEGGEGVENIFHFRPVWQRALVVLAGPVANFVLAILIFAGLAFAMGSYDRTSVISSVEQNSAAAEAGILPGDKILTMDGHDVSRFTALKSYVVLKSDTDIKTQVERNGEILELVVAPKRVEERDFVGGKASAGRLGVGLDSQSELIHIEYNPIEALGYGVGRLGSTLAMTGTYVGRIFQGKENGQQLGSVVKIATITGKSAVDAANADAPFVKRMQEMALRLIQLAAAISIGLGVANLMPIPVLDGGHLVYYAYEAVAGRPLSQEKQEFGFKIGFALLLTLFVALTINDIGYVSSIFS
ncbi:site-2 protease [Litorimonas taeanensis]|uniref:Site-2 protease n=1 Tax=Litorimonas taeanensis TaxID=568099 RepID=A0A420WKX9_9PROT|nr:M50 family metallopeptidase [Litorimonas taeanensis]RKQ71629.1 site-2 protease [Litorimonas taeanensis]